LFFADNVSEAVCLDWAVYWQVIERWCCLKVRVSQCSRRHLQLLTVASISIKQTRWITPLNSTPVTRLVVCEFGFGLESGLSAVFSWTQTAGTWTETETETW